MDSFRETAFYLTVWHTFLATLTAILLVTLNDFEPTTALLVATNITLIFSLALVVCAGRLTDRNIERGQFWRTLPPKERPAGKAGVRTARQVLETTWLRFAKGAAAFAIVLSALAYISHGTDRADAAGKPPTFTTIVSDSALPD
jgi:hypothetical protein